MQIALLQINPAAGDLDGNSSVIIEAAFRNLSLHSINGRPKTVIDCWRILPPSQFQAVADYLTLGKGPERAGLTADQKVRDEEDQFQSEARGD